MPAETLSYLAEALMNGRNTGRRSKIAFYVTVWMARVLSAAGQRASLYEKVDREEGMTNLLPQQKTLIMN